MSQSVHLTFFSRSRLRDPRAMLEAALRLTGAERAWFVKRSRGESRAWQAHVRSLDVPPQVISIAEPPVSAERVGDNVPLASVPALYQEGSALNVHFAANDLSSRLFADIQRCIPKELADDCMPCEPIVTMGFHDIFETSEQPGGTLIARAFFSFELFGYGTPRDWAEYRKRVFDVPEVASLRERLSLIVDDLEQCIYWSV